MISRKRLASVQGALGAFSWSLGMTQMHHRVRGPGFGLWESRGTLSAAPEAPPEPRSYTLDLIYPPSGRSYVTLFASDLET